MNIQRKSILLLIFTLSTVLCKFKQKNEFIQNEKIDNLHRRRIRTITHETLNHCK